LAARINQQNSTRGIGCPVLPAQCMNRHTTTVKGTERIVP